MVTSCFSTPRGLVLLSLHTSDPPSDQEWQEHLQTAQRAMETGTLVGGIAITDGGAPTGAQRGELAQLLAPLSRTHLAGVTLSRSTVVRAVVTALSWAISPQYKAFAPWELREALAHLGLIPADTAIVRRTIERLGAELPRAETARMVLSDPRNPTS
jgi:hypothetical protein